MDRTHSIYASHQILSSFTNTVLADIAEFALYSATALFIVGTYSLIRIKMPVILLFGTAAFIIISISLKSALELAVTSFQQSEACRRVGKSIWNRDRKYNVRFWKSRLPLSIPIGYHFKLETKQYILHLFGCIIFENIISLLLTF